MKIIILILILFSSYSCSSFFAEENYDIIPRDTFVMVLADMHLTDVLLVENRNFDRNLNDTTGKKSYYNILLKKHEINEYKFIKTVEYYSENTVEYSQIYTDVINELSKRRVEVLTPIDSLQNIKNDTLAKKIKALNIDSLSVAKEKEFKDSLREQLKQKRDSLNRPKFGKNRK